MPKGDRTILKADPEDGTTPIANLLLEALVLARLTSKERAAMLFLIRRTYGWQFNGKRQKVDIIPLSDWVKALRVKDATVASRILSKLEKRRVIKRHWLGPGKSYVYSINTRIDEWDNCFTGIVWTEISTLALNKMSRLDLNKRTISPITSQVAEKESVKRNKRNYTSGYMKNNKYVDFKNDPDKYIKGKYGHMVRR